MQSTYQIEQLLTIFYNGSYSITELMKRVSPITRTTNITLTQFLFRYNSPPQTFQLTPQCSSMLSKCRFHDEERNCSELFAFRKTQDGFCCTFNYATKGDDTHLWVQLNYSLIYLSIFHSFRERGNIISRAIQRNFLFFFTMARFTVARVVRTGRIIDWSRSRLKIWPRAVGCRCCWNHLWTITSTLFSPVPSGR